MSDTAIMLDSERASAFTRYLQLSREFFQTVGGTMGSSAFIERPNIEVIDPTRHESVLAASVEVSFTERSKFGSGSYLEAYSRYRRMRRDWWDFLEQNGFRQWHSSTSIVGHFLPLLKAPAGEGAPYPPEESPSPGHFLTSSVEVGPRHAYYEEVRRKFAIKWLLQDTNGIVIGPDVGLLMAVDSAMRKIAGPLDFWDVGAGTGEISALVLRSGRARSVLVNEYSERLQTHLRTYLGGLRDGETQIDFQFCDALALRLPPRAQIVSMGIYYGSQPAFLERHGDALSSALGPDGVVLVQSGMVEGRFNVASLTGDDERLRGWSWYSERNSLRSYFSVVESVMVATEIVTMASNSRRHLDDILRDLVERAGAQPMPTLKPFNMQ